MSEFVVARPAAERWDWVVEYCSFQDLCREVFGREPFWSDDHNGSYVQVDVSIDGTDYADSEELAAQVAAWLAAEPPEGTEEWQVSLWYRDHAPFVSLDALLWQLATWGRVPFGRYLMLVWW